MKGINKSNCAYQFHDVGFASNFQPILISNHYEYRKLIFVLEFVPYIFCVIFFKIYFNNEHNILSILT